MPALRSRTALQWLSLVGIIWLQSINGTNFNFPSYSSQLKHLLSISQFQLNNLAFASDAGKLLGWFSGFAALYLPLWLVLLIGSFLGFIGYGLQYLFLTHQIHSLSYWHIFFLTVLAGNSICWINTVCYTVAIKNFPSNSQFAVGISTSYQGLSAKIYNDAVDSVVSSSSPPAQRAKTFLLLNSVLPLMVSTVAAPLARDHYDYDQPITDGGISIKSCRKMKVGILVIFVITIGTGVFAVFSSLQSSLKSIVLLPLTRVVCIGVFLLVPLVVPFSEEVKEIIVGKGYSSRERRVHDFSIDENYDPEEERGSDSGVKEGEDGIELEVVDHYNDHDDVGFKEEIGVKVMLQRVNFWLYFFIYLFGATLGLVFLNNLGQIAESRRSSIISSLVSLSSSFGFFGRLMPSFLDYFFSRNKYYRKMSRPGFIVALMIPMGASFFLLLNPSNLSLYVSTAVIGVCTGAITSIAVSITTDLFGAKNFSVNHNVVVANIPLGSFCFGYLASSLYRKQAESNVNEQPAAAGKCIGTDCYKNTFIIWGSFCFLGVFLALVLYARTRKYYTCQKS